MELKKREKSIEHPTLCQPSILAVSGKWILDIHSAVCLCQYIMWALKAKISTSGKFPVIIFLRKLILVKNNISSKCSSS